LDISEVVRATKALLPTLQRIPTRFRAYQLGCAGTSFSYFDGTTFTLAEARVTETSRRALLHELEQCGRTRIDVLHITSWDRDHCALADLAEILIEWRPKKIQYPGYKPTTENSRACLEGIKMYCAEQKNKVISTAYTPEYVSNLPTASKYGYKDVVFHPRTVFDKANDNSTVKLFRTGCFNVLSLGDVESQDIAALIKSSRIACKEIDILLLPHHGANNGFLTSDFLDEIKPKLAICGVNHGNHYGHPADEVRALLARKNIPVATTIRGDVIVWSDNGTSTIHWADTKADTTAIQKQDQFEPKKYPALNQHADSIRARHAGARYRLL